jgi:hypothetical protein
MDAVRAAAARSRVDMWRIIGVMGIHLSANCVSEQGRIGMAE